MNDLFVDTSEWASWADRSQTHHLEAVEILDQLWNSGGVAVTSNWVLVELAALMTSPLRIPKPEQIRFFDALLHDYSVLVLTIDPELEDSAWALRRSRPAKQWSLADCASFRVMERKEIVEALTADRHFEQAGFRRLLKSP